MADPLHVELLKEGVDTWNAWRKDNPDILPDLSNAMLAGHDLSIARLQGATLAGAELSGTELMRANLNGAEMTSA
ncbi:MAG: pentapeptide repeat-containing protein, partial [Bacteroidota bacterium]